MERQVTEKINAVFRVASVTRLRHIAQAGRYVLQYVYPTNIGPYFGAQIVIVAKQRIWPLRKAINPPGAPSDTYICYKGGGGTSLTYLMAGGGYGDPFLRDPEAVRQDVMYGLVSIQSARDDYGVVITDSETCEIDVVATEALRSERGSSAG